jgi:hypothetical protein
MGKPATPADFVRVQCDDVEVYLSGEIWSNVTTTTERLLIAVDGYGRFWLRFTSTQDGGQP